MTIDLCFEVFGIGLVSGIIMKVTVDLILATTSRLISAIRNIFN